MGESYTNNRRPKDTRRVIIGWKHQDEKGPYKLIINGRGGGKQEVDIDKKLTKQETTTFLLDKYFPDGVNVSSGLHINEVDYHIATFTGHHLPDTLKSGKDFEFGEFVEELGSSPIRLYLHTIKKVKAYL